MGLGKDLGDSWDSSGGRLRVQFDDCVHDPDTRQLLRQGQPVRLTPKAFDLLGALLEARPRALSKAEIRDRIWPDAVVSEATLASVVSELRAALGDDAKDPRFVRTVHGHGYAFSGTAADATPSQPQTADPASKQSGRRPALVANAVAAVLAVGAAVMVARNDALPIPAGPHIVAVLPFQDLSGVPDQLYVADGLTDGLVTRLAESGWSVVARASALRYRGSARARPEIAKELGASWLVEGSVRRERDHTRVLVRLVEGTTGRAAWVRTYEPTSEETPQLPARVAREIAEASRQALTPRQRERLGSDRTVDPAAYDLYLRGRFLLARGSLEANRKAIEHFQEALGMEPSYAPAYASLANAYSTLASVWGGEPPGPMRALAAAAAHKALELDPDLADAHTYSASVKMYDWDFAGAERGFQRAIALDPGAANAHAGYAGYLITQNRLDEAVSEARRGEALDPLSARTRRYVGYTLFQARRYDQAIAQLQAVGAAEPRDTFVRLFLGNAYTLVDRHAEALSELEQAARLSERAPIIVGMLAWSLARAGRPAEARALVAELEEASRRRYVSPAAFVMAHCALDDREQVFRALDRGLEEKINFMVFLNSMEALDPYRSDPRFRDLVRRIGLPETRP